MATTTIATTKLLFLVTGGEKGIGREIVSQIFQSLPVGTTARVILASKDVDEGKEQMFQLRSQGKDVQTLQLNLKSSESIAMMARNIDALAESFGVAGLACLVNNAGIAFQETTFSAEMAQKTLEVNVFGTMELTTALLPSLKAFAKSPAANYFAPRIVFVSSQLGKLNLVPPSLQTQFASPAATHTQIDALLKQFIRHITEGNHRELGWPDNMYAVSNLGEIAHSRVFARELMNDGILVNSCDPGYTKTGITNWKGDQTPQQGAETPTWLATRPVDKNSVKAETGGLYLEKSLIEW
jgi:carbonyl reductase 1